MREFILKPAPQGEAFEELVTILNSKKAAIVYWLRSLQTQQQINEFTSIQDVAKVTDLYDVESFYELIKKHKELGSKVVVYGDYDADGAVAATIVWRFLSRVLGINATVYIPDRHEEGYGLNKEALLGLAAQGFGLVISVDCGVRDKILIEEIQTTTSMEIAVTDHHQPGDTFPTCVTVHPLYPGHESSNKFTSGGVVAWKTVRYLEDRFGLTHEYTDSVIDLAGISLITDIMPLTGENRLILSKAIQKLKGNAILGVKKIIEVAQVPSNEISTYHIGYIIGPRLNASGRIGNPYTSTRLLSTDKEEQALSYAQEVNEINIKRQVLTKKMLEEAEQVKQDINGQIIVASKEGWDDGIIGLVAGRLMNIHDLPTIAISVDTEKGTAKGSARSFGEFNITQLLEEISPVLERFGGHHNAAGFTLKSTDVTLFTDALSKVLSEKYPEFHPLLKKEVDCIVSAEDLTDEFFTAISNLEPYGPENAAPIFALKGNVMQFSTMGQQGNHVRIDLQTESGAVKAIAFDGIRYLGMLEQGKDFVLIGKPKKEIYMGRPQISFIVEQLLTSVELRSL